MARLSRAGLFSAVDPKTVATIAVALAGILGTWAHNAAQVREVREETAEVISDADSLMAEIDGLDRAIAQLQKRVKVLEARPVAAKPRRALRREAEIPADPEKAHGLKGFFKGLAFW